MITGSIGGGASTPATPLT